MKDPFFLFLGVQIAGTFIVLIPAISFGLYNHFTMTPEERNRELGLDYKELCIEGVKYIKGFSSKSSFTVLVDKEGKPLECNK